MKNPFVSTPQTTEEALSCFSKGVDILRNVFDHQTEQAEFYRDEAACGLALADLAESDANRAARIIKRFDEFVS